MAKVNFENVTINSNQETSTNNVGFFSLKNDGDEAIVRIMHDSTADFEILTVHPITVDGKFRAANCLRDPHDSVEKCPLCASNSKINQRIYLHLVQYDRAQDGSIVASPKVWERSIAYATKLKTLIDEYGPLSNCIFKIKRNGKAGSVDTTYEILFCNPAVYTPEVYKPVDAFSNYSAIGRVVLDKTAEELNTFIATGKFAAKSNNDNRTNSGNNVGSYANVNQVPSYATSQPMPEFVDSSRPEPVQTTQAPTQSMPWERPQANSIQRPVRHY
jgi:hypothetical protein